MKRSILVLSSVIAYVLFSAVSCEDPEPFVTVKPIESAVYKEIKTFREANGLTGAFVQNYPMTEEAQIFSITMAYSDDDVIDTTGISAHWNVIHDKFGGYNDLTLLQSTTATTAAEIAANWTGDSTYIPLILGDYTQCGVGIEYSADQLTFVTLMMMKAD